MSLPHIVIIEIYIFINNNNNKCNHYMCDDFVDEMRYYNIIVVNHLSAQLVPYILAKR